MQLITQRSLIKEFLSEPHLFWDEWRQKAAALLDAETITKDEVINVLGEESRIMLNLPSCDECESSDKEKYMLFQLQYGHDACHICSDCMDKAVEMLK